MLLNPKYLKCDRSTCDPHKNGDESPFPSYRVFNPPRRLTAAHTPQPGLAAKVTPSAAPRASPHRPPPPHTHSPRPCTPSSFCRLRRGPTAPLGSSLVLNMRLGGQQGILKPRTQKRKGRTLSVPLVYHQTRSRATCRNAGACRA